MSGMRNLVRMGLTHSAAAEIARDLGKKKMAKLRTVDLQRINAHEFGKDGITGVTVAGVRCETVTTAQPFGGVRWWWLCPVCGRRVADLYIAERAACRHCHRLTYGSIQERRDWLDTCDIQVAKLRRLLKTPEGWAWESIPPRPRYMHWSTYGRLAWELQDLLKVRRWAFYVELSRILASGPSGHAAPVPDDDLEQWIAEMYRAHRRRWGRG